MKKSTKMVDESFLYMYVYILLHQYSIKLNVLETDFEENKIGDKMRIRCLLSILAVPIRQILKDKESNKQLV